MHIKSILMVPILGKGIPRNWMFAYLLQVLMGIYSDLFFKQSVATVSLQNVKKQPLRA